MRIAFCFTIAVVSSICVAKSKALDKGAGRDVKIRCGEGLERFQGQLRSTQMGNPCLESGSRQITGHPAERFATGGVEWPFRLHAGGSGGPRFVALAFSER